jgi:hypothetical protein
VTSSAPPTYVGAIRELSDWSVPQLQRRQPDVGDWQALEGLLRGNHVCVKSQCSPSSHVISSAEKGADTRVSLLFLTTVGLLVNLRMWTIARVSVLFLGNPDRGAEHVSATPWKSDGRFPSREYASCDATFPTRPEDIGAKGANWVEAVKRYHPRSLECELWQDNQELHTLVKKFLEERVTPYQGLAYCQHLSDFD